MTITRSIRNLAATALVSALLVTGATSIAAQDASPTPVTTERGATYPVSIHAGTCDSPVAQPIGPTIDTEIAGFDAETSLIGDAIQPPVLVAEADVEATLDELTDTPHVVAVHVSAEAYGEIVACGEIAGYENDGKLVFGLRSVEDSPVSGIAILDDAPDLLDRALEAIDQEELLGDGKLRLTVYIAPDDIEDAGA